MLIDERDLAVNLTLEILKGCGYSCQDCAIDKSATDDHIGEGDTENLLALVDGWKAQGYRLHEFTIGPTDICASKTGLAVLDHPLVKGLAQRYDSLTVSLAMLFDTQLIELAQKVEVLMAGKALRVIIPTTLKNAGNQKFMSAVKTRVGILKAFLHSCELKMVYLSVNVVNASAANFTPETNRIVNNVDLGVRKLVEYVFPHSRRGFDNLMVFEEFKRDFATYVQGIQDSNNSSLNRFLIPTASDSQEITYRDGKLYYTPVLMEKFPIFAEQFEMSWPWQAEDLMTMVESKYHLNLMDKSEHPTCGDCCFLDECARGDMHTLMDFFQHEGCLINMKNRLDLVPLSDPVRRDE